MPQLFGSVTGYGRHLHGLIRLLLLGHGFTCSLAF